MSAGIESIGFIGLGSMGAAQACELAPRPDIPLSVFDVSLKARHLGVVASERIVRRKHALLGPAEFVGRCGGRLEPQ